MVHRGHDSGNTSYGVRIGAHAWFVKHAEADEPIRHLESAIVFHAAVRHAAIIPLVGWFRTATVWRSSSSFRMDSSSTIHSRPVRCRVITQSRRMRASVTCRSTKSSGTRYRLRRACCGCQRGVRCGGLLRRRHHLRFREPAGASVRSRLVSPGPYRLDRERQYGSTRFMAPRSSKGATIDERTTVFTLGRAAFVFLSEGQRGETDAHLWRGPRALYDVVRAATEIDPDNASRPSPSF